MRTNAGPFEVEDIAFSDLSKSHYNLGIFACGYENRCRFILESFGNFRMANRDNEFIQKHLVLHFQEHRSHPIRGVNNIFFNSLARADHIDVSQNDETPLYRYLNSMELANREEFRIIVDYSSMSRLWYAGILNWIRTMCEGKSIQVDFVYSLGEYRNEIYPLVIRDILSIPGCGGAPEPSQRTVAVFGLGFDGESTLAVFDKLQADQVYAVIAAPGVSLDAPGVARERNKEFLAEKVTTLELPLRSVKTTYSRLAEVIGSHLGAENVVLVPMGPKPHVLSTILIGMRFPEITLLRVSGSRKRRGTFQEPIEAQGEIIATRVVL